MWLAGAQALEPSAAAAASPGSLEGSWIRSGQTGLEPALTQHGRVTDGSLTHRTTMPAPRYHKSCTANFPGSYHASHLLSHV